MVRVVVNSALRGGKIERPWLGADLQAVTPDIAEGLGLDRPRGAVVVRLMAGGPAEKAGLRVGDVITAVDGRDVTDPQAVLYRFATKGVGGDAALDVVAKGRKRQVRMALIAAPETPPRDAREIDGANPFAGATVANLSPAVAEELSLSETAGVVVLETKAYSTARRLGLRPGDIIAKLNGDAIRDVRQLSDMVSQRTRAWDLTIRRGNEEFRTVVRG
jgi:S1-C subfamily serine protease